MPKNSIHLTAQEQAVFEKLPAVVRDGWTVVPESLTAYETQRQLKIRREIFRKKDPEFQTLVTNMRKLKKGDGIEKIGEIPRPLLLKLFFTMGAGFLRDCITAILPGLKAAPDTQGVATLSVLRHLILEANAKPIA